MNTLKKIIWTSLLTLFTLSGFAQIEHPVKWSYSSKRTGNKEAVVFLKATIEDTWHIYSAYQQDGGPVKTSFEFAASKDYSLDGKIEEPTPASKFEKAFNMKVSYFENAVIFQQKVHLNAANPVVMGKLTFMVCNNQKCLPPETITFSVPVN